MNKLFLIAISIISFASLHDQTELTVTHKFLGIVEGYDHKCKTQVWIDDELVGESPENLESQGATFTVNVPKGHHDVLIINQAFYDGAWEDHTIENDYSIDCLWEGTHNFSKKKEKIFLLFDIDNGTSVSWKKMPKPAKS